MGFLDDYEPLKERQVLFFLLDTSESMQGTKIDIANTFIRNFITSDYLAKSTEKFDLKIICLAYSTTCKWLSPTPVSLEDFKWNDIASDAGSSNLGEVCLELNEKILSGGFLHDSTYYPVFILVSDGKVSDNYMSGIEQLKKNRDFDYATKLALAIGNDADKNVLAEFTGDTEKVVHICTTKDFDELIWIFSLYAGRFSFVYKNCSPLMIAAMYCGKEVVEPILESGANVNSKSSLYNTAGYEWVTPLMAATKNNNKELAELLINYGADVNAISSGSRGGQTALMIAAEHNSKETAELLIEHGADVNAKTKWRTYEDCTALMFAAWYEAKETAEVLIKNGADVNAARNDRQTALMFAKRQNAKEIVKLLVEHGAVTKLAKTN